MTIIQARPAVDKADVAPADLPDRPLHDEPAAFDDAWLTANHLDQPVPEDEDVAGELPSDADQDRLTTWPRDPDLSLGEELDFREDADLTLGLWWVKPKTRERLLATLSTEDLLEVAVNLRTWMKNRDLEPLDYADPKHGLTKDDFTERLWAWSEAAGNTAEYHRISAGKHKPDLLRGLIEPASEWASRAPEDEPSIIPGVLIAGGLGVVSGPPKGGKSWWLFALALAVANGVPLLGIHQVERPGRVLYIATEGNHRRTRARLFSLARGHELDPDRALSRIDFIWRQRVRLDDTEVLAALSSRAPDYTLIVVDLTRHVWRGKSTDDGEVEGYLEGLRQVTTLGPTIINCLHTAKAPAEGSNQRTDGERILGSQLWFGGADSLIYINKPKGSRVARVTFEARDDMSHLPMLMTLPDQLIDGREPTSLAYRSADGQTANTAGLTDEVARRVRETPGLTKSTMATLVSARKADVLAAIDLLCNSGTIYYDGTRHALFPSSFPQTQEPLGTAELVRQVVRVPALKGGNAELPGEREREAMR